MQMDIFSPILEKFAPSPKPVSGGGDMKEMVVAILHKLIVENESGGEAVSDPMSELLGMPGGDIWQQK
jgi:hypothetical protein